MIGNIKIILDNARLSEEGEKKFKHPRKRNGYISYIYEIESIHSEKGIDILTVTLCKYENNNIIKFETNLSKWFLGKDLELSYTLFIECLELIENRIGLEKGLIWNSKITQIEFGIIEKCRKEEYIEFLGLIKSHKELKKIKKLDTKIMFIGVNYSWNLFKIDDINDNHSEEERVLYKCLLKIEKVSGVEKILNLISSLDDIKNRWNDLIDLQEMYLNDIIFNVPSIKIIIIKERKLNILLRKKLKKEFNKKLILRKKRRLMEEVLSNIKIALRNKENNQS